MREYTTSLQQDVAPARNLALDVRANARLDPARTVLHRRTPEGWVEVTAERFHEEVRAVAKGLAAAGVRPGDRVALLSRTRYEWTLVDYAVWYAGAVTVPLYDSASTQQVEAILADSGSCAVVVETAAHRERLDEIRPGLPDLGTCWVIEEGGLDELTRRGEGVEDREIDRRLEEVDGSAPATIVYTSGTTAGPRGCVLTHANLDFEVTVALRALAPLFEDPASSTLLFLPLAHVFARVIQVGCVRARVPMGHTPDAGRLAGDLVEVRPTFVLAVPRLFEKLFNRASQEASIAGRGGAFDRAAETAIAYSRALDQGRVPLRLRAAHRMHTGTYQQIMAMFGGRCAYAVSGGAPLGERLAHLYRGVGLTILEGYGLTETTAAVTVNRPHDVRLGTVGQPLEGTTVRVGADGEVFVKGPQVMPGYWHEPDDAEGPTADGFLATGDLGEIDDEGFLRILGRKKEILVTAGGKNVAPAALEEVIRSHPLVSQCLVLGDGRPFIAALVTLDAEAVRQWARSKGKPTAPDALTDDEDLRAEIQTAVDEANAGVSQAEAVRRFVVLPADWTEESGQLTPSLKVRRGTVLKAHRTDIDRLYRD